MPDHADAPPPPPAPPDTVIFDEEPLQDDIFAAEPGAVVPIPGVTGLGAGRRRRRNLGPIFWISVGWMGVVIVLAVLANVLPLHDPNATGVGSPNDAPGIHHLLGTDQLGRDMFSRVVFG